VNQSSVSEYWWNPRYANPIKILPLLRFGGVAAESQRWEKGRGATRTWGCEGLAETSHSDPRLYAATASQLSESCDVLNLRAHQDVDSWENSGLHRPLSWTLSKRCTPTKNYNEVPTKIFNINPAKSPLGYRQAGFARIELVGRLPYQRYSAPSEAPWTVNELR
jgi:hypothetical protein